MVLGVFEACYKKKKCIKNVEKAPLEFCPFVLNFLSLARWAARAVCRKLQKQDRVGSNHMVASNEDQRHRRGSWVEMKPLCWLIIAFTIQLIYLNFGWPTQEKTPKLTNNQTVDQKQAANPKKGAKPQFQSRFHLTCPGCLA